MTDAEILAGLTKAQRRVVMEGRLYYGRGYWPLYHALREKDLVVPMFGNPLTETGLRIRALLKEQNDG